MVIQELKFVSIFFALDFVALNQSNFIRIIESMFKVFTCLNFDAGCPNKIPVLQSIRLKNRHFLRHPVDTEEHLSYITQNRVPKFETMTILGLTKCMMPAAVSHTDMKIEISWANLGLFYTATQHHGYTYSIQQTMIYTDG